MEATRALLAEKGPAGTTIQAVARLAKVRPNAIYRRWPTRISLIGDAIFPGFDTLTFTPTGDLSGDLERFVATYRSVLAQPDVLAAIPFLWSAKDRGGESPSPDHWELRSVRPLFRSILASAPDTVVDRTIDADDVFDLLIGAILHRVQLLALGRREGSADHLVDLVCRMLRPR